MSPDQKDQIIKDTKDGIYNLPTKTNLKSDIFVFSTGVGEGGLVKTFKNVKNLSFAVIDGICEVETETQKNDFPVGKMKGISFDNQRGSIDTEFKFTLRDSTKVVVSVFF
jgi:hypothetical protein